MKTIQEIAVPILAMPQDLSDLRGGDQVICMDKGPYDWAHPLASFVWTVDEVSDDALLFQTAAGPDYRHSFDLGGNFKGLSWHDPSLAKSLAERRLYRRSPEIEYLVLWRTLYQYIQHAWNDLQYCSTQRLKQFSQALQQLDLLNVVSELQPATVEQVLALQTKYYLRHGDSSLSKVLANAHLHDLARVRVGMYAVWGHQAGFGWRLGLLKIIRTTRRFVWVGEPGVARKFDRDGRYRNQTHLDSFALWQERDDLLFLPKPQVKNLLIRQQLVGDFAVQGNLLKKLPVEGLEPIYQILKTFPHITEARRDDASKEKAIDQQLEEVPKHVSLC